MAEETKDDEVEILETVLSGGAGAGAGASVRTEEAILEDVRRAAEEKRRRREEARLAAEAAGSSSASAKRRRVGVALDDDDEIAVVDVTEENRPPTYYEEQVLANCPFHSLNNALGAEVISWDKVGKPYFQQVVARKPGYRGMSLENIMKKANVRTKGYYNDWIQDMYGLVGYRMVPVSDNPEKFPFNAAKKYIIEGDNGPFGHQVAVTGGYVVDSFNIGEFYDAVTHKFPPGFTPRRVYEIARLKKPVTIEELIARDRADEDKTLDLTADD